MAPQQDESMSPTIQPSPPPGVARAKPLGLCKPIEGSCGIAKIHRREADLLVSPRLAGIFSDHRLGGSDAIFELALRSKKCSSCLQQNKVARLDCQRTATTIVMDGF